jgi:D-alanyl-lipoteichoic acid acyltransferase DltB (MBOAT superfamily)
LLHVVLPLGISFFTFQQMSYLVDSYRGVVKHDDPLDYMLFVTFFPQLIAGPIVHHSEMMPQFARDELKQPNSFNIGQGIFVFFIGLFKKVVIADTFATWATQGFDVAEKLSLVEAWVTSLSYTLQLYFDFSGYTDMAIGAALLFNIKIPINFNTPYKSLDIQEFWQRWHMTLSRFLRDYLYIPLGGNRKGELLAARNALITFTLGGLWHGAGWTFVFWGFMHGAGLVVVRFWRKLGISMPTAPAWAITFLFVNVGWVFFRAKEWGDAFKVLRGMVGLDGVKLPSPLANKLGFLTEHGVTFGNYLSAINGSEVTLLWLILFLPLSFLGPNSMELADKFQFNWRTALMVMILGTIAILHLNRVSEFLYFQF